MLKELIFIAVIVAVAVALLCIRLLLGKKNIVNTHIDGNAEMERRGIHCAVQQDMEQRLAGGLKIEEHK